MDFIGIPSSSAEGIWPLVVVWIAAAAAESSGRYSADDYKEAILSRDMQLWCVVDGLEMIACVVTEIVDYPRSRWLSVKAIGGSRHAEWLKNADSILSRFAAEKQCIDIEAVGRLGWSRELRRLGWNVRANIYEKGN